MYPLLHTNGQSVPLGTGGVQLGNDPFSLTAAARHGIGPQVNVGCVHAEVPGPVPVQVPVTESAVPPSVRSMPPAHCRVHVLPVVPVAQLLATIGSLSGAQLAGTQFEVLPE
jgi:hypothetical protein